MNDGFGTTVQSSTLTVALTNTNPTVSTPILRTGVDLSVVNPATIYFGSQIKLDASAAFDPDGLSNLSFTWSGQPCTTESLGCLFASYPGGSCRGITINPDPVDPLNPAKASFTAPPFGPNSPTVCGLRVVVTDPAGGSTTLNWAYTLKANAGGPTAVIAPPPDKMANSVPGHPSVLALDGSGSSDPDTAPVQPLAYQWEQVDPSSGAVIALTTPLGGTFSTPTSKTTGWTAPSSAPLFVAFRLSVDDGITFKGRTQSTTVKIITPRPGSNAGSDRMSHPGETAALDGSASFDSLGRSLTYQWQQISGPSVTIKNALSAQASIVAPHIDQGGDSQTPW